MKATRESYGEFLKELKKDNVYVLDADLSSSTKTIEFKNVHPDKFINCGIAEASMVSTAAGLASMGNLVFCSSFGAFLPGKVYDQIRQSIAYNDTNVKICSTHNGISPGEDGPTHQMLEDVSLMRAMPNMRVFVPSDDISTKSILNLLASDKKPAYVRLSRKKTREIYKEEDSKAFYLGSSYTHGNGTDICIITNGDVLEIALDAKEMLEKENISVRVLDMYSVKPIDEENIVKSFNECKNILVVENHTRYGGLYGAVCEVSAKTCPKRVYNISIDRFGKSGKEDEVYRYFGLSKENIYNKVKKIIRGEIIEE